MFLFLSYMKAHLYQLLFIKPKILFICLSLIVSGLHCCVQSFSSCSEQGQLSSSGAWASHCSGFSCCGAQALGHAGSVVAAHGLQSLAVAHGLICSTAHGIFPDQRLNPHPLHWQGDSYPLYHQGSSLIIFYILSFVAMCLEQQQIVKTHTL